MSVRRVHPGFNLCVYINGRGMYISGYLCSKTMFHLHYLPPVKVSNVFNMSVRVSQCHPKVCVKISYRVKSHHIRTTTSSSSSTWWWWWSYGTNGGSRSRRARGRGRAPASGFSGPTRICSCSLIFCGTIIELIWHRRHGLFPSWDQRTWS
jgi:hypothetical protein